MFLLQNRVKKNPLDYASLLLDTGRQAFRVFLEMKISYLLIHGDVAECS